MRREFPSAAQALRVAALLVQTGQRCKVGRDRPTNANPAPWWHVITN